VRALLDTSVLVALSELGESTPDLSDIDYLLVSTLSFAELVIGIHAATNVSIVRHRIARLSMLRQTLGQGLPFDESCMRAYEQILTHVSDNGGDAKARRFDRLIAATALAHDATLITRNFEHVANLSALLAIEVR